MFRLFSKNSLLALVAVLSLGTMKSSVEATECCDLSDGSRVYVGAFGGGLYSNSTRFSQLGTAFFAEADGGPLAVHANGNTKRTSSAFGGIQMGYRLLKCPLNIGCSNWSLAPALEMEGFWYSHCKSGHLINPTNRLPEHDFLDSFRVNAGVYLANAVFSINNFCFSSLTPYVGGGIGAARLSLRDGRSVQTSPVEPRINHFNSRKSDSTWAFAGQLKAGLKYNICQALHIFAEYRYLFIDSSNYIFGSTIYQTHVPTSPWNVRVKNIKYNAFVVGLQYDL